MKKILIVIVVALLILFVVRIVTLYPSNETRYTEKINAKVVDAIEKKITTGTRFPRTMLYYFLEVEYQIEDEIIKTTCEGSLSAYSKSKIGEEIEVLYNPNDKNKCKLINAIN